MIRHWLLTSTFYGTWLPGDPRGFVGRVRDRRPEDAPEPARVQHDVPGTPYDQDLPGLHRASAALLKGKPVLIGVEHAQLLLAQFRETATYRGWTLLAVAILPNHIHLVVQTPDEANVTKVLGDFKAYGSRRLTAHFGKPLSGTWWTYDGSKRLLSDDRALAAAIHYVLYKQGSPLVTWCPPVG